MRFMSSQNLNFRRFVEEMDLTMDKKVGNSNPSRDDEPIDFFSALADEAGIEWSVLKKILQSEPWVSTHFSLGPDNFSYKVNPWEIVKGSLTPQGAYIRLKKIPGSRIYLKGRRLNKSCYFDDSMYFLTRKQLIDFFNQDQTYVSSWQNQGGGISPPSMI